MHRAGFPWHQEKFIIHPGKEVMHPKYGCQKNVTPLNPKLKIGVILIRN